MSSVGRLGTARLDTLLEAGSIWRAQEKEYTQPKTIEAGSFLPSGLPQGTVHEWFSGGIEKRGGKTPPPLTVIAAVAKNSLAALLKRAPKHSGLVLWIGKSVWPTPHLLKEIGGDTDLISRSLFIATRNKKEKFWAIDTALRSPGVIAVIAECESIPCSLSKRLSLAAKHGGAIGFIIRKNADLGIPSAAMARWYVKPMVSSEEQPAWDVELVRSKGTLARDFGSRTHWVVGVSHEKSSGSIPIPFSSVLVDRAIIGCSRSDSSTGARPGAESSSGVECSRDGRRRA